ncbi:MAG: transposase [Bdellovibrionales bacterium]|nr:transposase [Bdellovibrionales bacterium]
MFSTVAESISSCPRRASKTFRRKRATLFPNIAAVLRLVTAILAEIHEDWMTAPMAYVSMK